MYCDLNVNDEGRDYLYTDMYLPHSNNEDESYPVCHKGYLSLFPFLLEHLPPTSEHLGHILDLLHDPEHLWSPFGIRSLSASHPEFGKGENYWKGPIWIQMNYLALRALHKVIVPLAIAYCLLKGIFRPTLRKKDHTRRRPSKYTRNFAGMLFTTWLRCA